jgi:hypothetical protein
MIPAEWLARRAGEIYQALCQLPHGLPAYLAMEVMAPPRLPDGQLAPRGGRGQSLYTWGLERVETPEALPGAVARMVSRCLTTLDAEDPLDLTGQGPGPKINVKFVSENPEVMRRYDAIRSNEDFQRVFHEGGEETGR